MVSVITPAHNSSEHIAETMMSVLAQTHPEWEMIVVDDCSTDHTGELVQEFSQHDPRIRLIELKDHLGPAEARNKAIRAASGRYIAFLDSDDLWHPHKLERQINFMQQNGWAFTFTNYQRIKGHSGKRMNVVKVPRTIDYSGYLRNTIIGALTVIIDREKTGDFKMPNLRTSHDMALWCDILKRGFQAHGLRETLAYYRVVNSSNTAKKIRAAYDVWRVYRRVEKMALLPSMVNFMFYAFHAARKRIH
jgi:teichuronic acid biosynthesis glycosyltransferase TuaG